MYIKSLTYILLLLQNFNLLISCSPYIPTSDDCANYFSINNLPQQCQQTNNTCYFKNGFQFISNETQTQLPFMFCLDLPGYSIEIQCNETIYEQISSLYIFGEQFIINENYFMNAYNGLYLVMEDQIQLYKSTILGSKIWLSANLISMVNFTLTNDSLLSTDCNCVNQQECIDWNFKFPQLFNKDNPDIFNISIFPEQLNYTGLHQNSVVLLANQSIEIDQSNVRISIIGVFTNNFVLSNSTLNTSALGFPSSYGQGCGYYDEVLHQLLNCMGTGGSHGGYGGNSYPENCYLLMSKPPYGSIQYPFAPGSGGGFFISQSKESSSGGGIVNIQAVQITVSYSKISSEGKTGIQGGGGGAGGSVLIDYLQLNSTRTEISVKGGNGQKSSSGAGGRIRLFNYNWKNQPQTKNYKELSVHIDGGQLCPTNLSCGQNGSVFTSPCRPGFQLANYSYICIPCKPGTYQMTYGYSQCIPCSGIPQNSQYIQNNSDPLDYSKSCAFECNSGYESYSSPFPSCLKPGQHAFYLMGGENLLICLSIIVGSIMLFCLVMIFKKLSENDSFSNGENQLASNLLQKSYFRMEDIPFHELRLYIDGFNHPFDPWKIEEEVENNFFAQLKNPLTKINHTLSKAIKQINTIGQYSKYQKILLICFKYTYYPLSRLILGSLRRKRAKQIFASINNLNKKIPDFQNLQIKFNLKPQMTICSLEIFNYTKSVLDFYIENYYPLFFMLERAPFGGYSIDFSDPFLKVFINQINERDNSQSKNLQVFFLQLNKLLKTPNRFFPLMSYLWSIKNLYPHLQAYLWQPPNIILGINKEYEINPKIPLFLMISSQNINNRHFIFSENLPCIHFSEIECLKNKFTVRKEISLEDEKINFWVIHNSFSLNNLFASFGILNVISLLLAIVSFFLIIYVIVNNHAFFFGTIIFFILWPLCDFAVVVFNFRAILSKNQYLLADGIQFNIVTLIKTFILFLASLIDGLVENNQDSQVQVVMFVWLVQFFINAIIYIISLMLRDHIV